MMPRACFMHRRGWMRAPGTARAAGSPPHTERAGGPPTRGGAAAHNVDGNMGEPVPPATTSRRATPPSTLWTAAGAISAAQMATRAPDDRNKTGSDPDSERRTHVPACHPPRPPPALLNAPKTA